jgi:hypothetical protein
VGCRLWVVGKQGRLRLALAKSISHRVGESVAWGRPLGPCLPYSHSCEPFGRMQRRVHMSVNAARKSAYATGCIRSAHPDRSCQKYGLVGRRSLAPACGLWIVGKASRSSGGVGATEFNMFRVFAVAVLLSASALAQPAPARQFLFRLEPVRVDFTPQNMKEDRWEACGVPTESFGRREAHVCRSGLRSQRVLGHCRGECSRSRRRHGVDERGSGRQGETRARRGDPVPNRICRSPTYA